MATDGTFSDYCAHSVLNHVHADGTFAAITDVFVGLTTVIPVVGDTGATVTEPDATWTNYARIELVQASHDAAASRRKNYSAIIDFGTAVTTADTNIVGWFTADSVTIGAGNLLFVGTTDGTIIVQNGNPVSIPANQFDTRIAPEFAAVP